MNRENNLISHEISSLKTQKNEKDSFISRFIPRWNSRILPTGRKRHHLHHTSIYQCG
jgi:hypothetical protein